MSRYFFDVHDGEMIVDPTGVELDSLDEARTEAVALFGGMLADAPSRFTKDEVWKVIVRDETRQLFTFSFAIDADAT